MENRRDFFKAVAALGVAELAGVSPNTSAAETLVSTAAEPNDRD